MAPKLRQARNGAEMLSAGDTCPVNSGGATVLKAHRCRFRDLSRSQASFFNTTPTRQGSSKLSSNWHGDSFHIQIVVSLQFCSFSYRSQCRTREAVKRGSRWTCYRCHGPHWAGRCNRLTLFNLSQSSFLLRHPILQVKGLKGHHFIKNNRFSIACV